MAESGSALARLDEELEAAGRVSVEFRDEMARLRGAMAGASGEAGALGRGIETGLRRALDGMARDGARLSDVLRGIGRQVSDSVFRAAARPVTQALGEAFAPGGLSGRVTAFARGGVLSGPVQFPMRGGTGLMGEAGPEAIMPLARGADGRLGVAASGGVGRPVNVVFNINTPDVAGFRRSQSQIVAQLGRVLARAERNG